MHTDARTDLARLVETLRHDIVGGKGNPVAFRSIKNHLDVALDEIDAAYSAPGGVTVVPRPHEEVTSEESGETPVGVGDVGGDGAADEPGDESVGMGSPGGAEGD